MGTQIAVTLRPDEPFDLNARLTLLVTELVDKWLTPDSDRRPIPQAKILLITRRRQQEIVLTPHNPKASWRQYEFWYLGGRSEVRLSIKRT
ncbi:MAG: hypothetical protein NTZ11_11710 [Gammaproteobacteria bacterium]|nr:hypothetical protein [Gammaproteobacteria bacterium]